MCSTNGGGSELEEQESDFYVDTSRRQPYKTMPPTAPISCETEGKPLSNVSHFRVWEQCD